MTHKKTPLWLYGIHACKAAIMNTNRIVLEVSFLTDHSFALLDLPQEFPKSKIKKREKIWFETQFGIDSVHQGIAVHVMSLPSLSIDYLEGIETPHQIVLILDQINDPRNIGALLRSAAAFGVKAILMTDRHTPDESQSLAKSASGALEIVPLIRCSNLIQTIDHLKKIGFWIYGLSEKGKMSLDTLNFSGKIGLILGNEGKGMRQLTSKTCDILTRLETSVGFSTLNVSNAGAIALHKIFCDHQNLARKLTNDL